MMNSYRLLIEVFTLIAFVAIEDGTANSSETTHSASTQTARGGEILAWLPTPVKLFDNSLTITGSPDLAEDDDGTVHLVWCLIGNGVGYLIYQVRSAEGNWSGPQVLFGSSEEPANRPRIMIDTQHKLHVFWETDRYHNYLGYMTKPAGGVWSEVTPIVGPRTDINLRMSTDGTIHLLAEGTYRKLPIGSSTWQVEVLPFYPSDFQFDASGTMHAVYSDGDVGEVYYARRQVDGTWTIPVNVSNNDASSVSPQVRVSSTGTVHVLWRDDWPYPCFPLTCTTHDLRHAIVASTGVAGEPVVSNVGSLSYFQVDVDAEDSVHTVWIGDNYQACYSQRPAIGAWATPICHSTSYGTTSLVVTRSSAVHWMWTGGACSDCFKHQWHAPGVNWSEILNPSSTIGILLFNGYVVKSANEDAPGSLHRIHLVFVGSGTLYYNDFSIANAPPTPTHTLTETPTPSQISTFSATPTETANPSATLTPTSDRTPTPGSLTVSAWHAGTFRHGELLVFLLCNLAIGAVGLRRVSSRRK
jgi:hypothetical protein